MQIYKCNHCDWIRFLRCPIKNNKYFIGLCNFPQTAHYSGCVAFDGDCLITLKLYVNDVLKNNKTTFYKNKISNDYLWSWMRDL